VSSSTISTRVMIAPVEELDHNPSLALTEQSRLRPKIKNM
jgi:hypothetical protein